MMTFYNIISALTALVVLPLFTLYSLLTGKKRQGLAHHFGFVPRPHTHGDKSRKVLWVHALSRGEINAAAPILRQIREDSPNTLIAVSVTTDSGFEGARERLPFVDHIMFHPLDCWPFIALAVNRIQPDLFVIVDTGFWPGLLHLLHKQNVPMILINGRISKKSIRRYKMFGPVSGAMFKNFSKLCMQNQQSLDAVISLGADTSRVQICGDSKLDALQPVPDTERNRIRNTLGIADGVYVWVAGSSHAGEEVIILEALKLLLTKYPDLTLILAPRRMERISEVQDLLAERNLPYLRQSQIGEGGSTNKGVIVLDTMGELANIYSIADVCFVGKSLIAPGGGHSLIEPVVQGKPVLHGPYVENIRDTADELGETGLGITVRNAQEIEAAISKLLEDESLRNELAQQAQTFIEEKKGASREIASLIREHIIK